MHLVFFYGIFFIYLQHKLNLFNLRKMKLYNLKELDRYYVVGDIEGNFVDLQEIIKRNLIPSKKESKNDTDNLFKKWVIKNSLTDSINIKNSLIVVCGDSNFGKFDEDYNDNFKELNSILSTNNIFLFFVRGNNDDPSYFSEEKINLSNVKTIPDYSLIQIKNKNIFCIGGGISIDRDWRKNQELRLSLIPQNHSKHLYWKNEAPFLDTESLDEIKSNFKIDSIITHIAPTLCPPDEFNNEWVNGNNSLQRDIELSRLIMDNILCYLIQFDIKPKIWYYTHYKIFNVETRSGIKFVSLNDDLQFNSNDDDDITNVHSKKLNYIQKAADLPLGEIRADYLNDYHALADIAMPAVEHIQANVEGYDLNLGDVADEIVDGMDEMHNGEDRLNF